MARAWRMDWTAGRTGRARLTWTCSSPRSPFCGPRRGTGARIQHSAIIMSSQDRRGPQCSSDRPSSDPHVDPSAPLLVFPPTSRVTRKRVSLRSPRSTTATHPVPTTLVDVASTPSRPLQTS